jgi:hypothetical protein
MSHKLAFKWLGPFRIKDAQVENGTFTLEELDGAQIRGTVAGNRLKHFVLQQDQAGDSGQPENDAKLKPPKQIELFKAIDEFAFIPLLFLAYLPYSKQ